MPVPSVHAPEPPEGSLGRVGAGRRDQRTQRDEPTQESERRALDPTGHQPTRSARRRRRARHHQCGSERDQEGQPATVSSPDADPVAGSPPAAAPAAGRTSTVDGDLHAGRLPDQLDGVDPGLDVGGDRDGRHHPPSASAVAEPNEIGAEWSVTSTVSPGRKPTAVRVTEPPATTDPTEACTEGTTGGAGTAGHVTSSSPASTGATVPIPP